MTLYEKAQQHLQTHQYTWLITGVSGFIGSNLLETLLQLNQMVKGIDNFSTGYQRNLDNVQASCTPEQWREFTFKEGDILSLEDCSESLKGVDFVLHQAALGSIPRSLADPLSTHRANVDGFVNMLFSARDAGVKRFVYASSSSVYGDHEALPKLEQSIGQALSPYALTKQLNENYAEMVARCYEIETVGLRYFNVFGQRQNPDGEYSAVIPRWINQMLSKKPVSIFGDGTTSRDFCYIKNAVQANLMAALSTNERAVNQVYNVAVSQETTLNELFHMIRQQLLPDHAFLSEFEPVYQPFRAGDVHHSRADISKARTLLGYEPTHTIKEGLADCIKWFASGVSP